MKITEVTEKEIEFPNYSFGSVYDEVPIKDYDKVFGIDDFYYEFFDKTYVTTEILEELSILIKKKTGLFFNNYDDIETDINNIKDENQCFMKFSEIDIDTSLKLSTLEASIEVDIYGNNFDKNSKLFDTIDFKDFYFKKFYIVGYELNGLVPVTLTFSNITKQLKNETTIKHDSLDDDVLYAVLTGQFNLELGQAIEFPYENEDEIALPEEAVKYILDCPEELEL